MTTQPDAMQTLVEAVARAAGLCPPSLEKTLLEACDAVEAEYDALQAKLDKQDWQVIMQAKVVEVEKPEPLTVVDQITKWAEANYSKSHSAQEVVEGCWSSEELNEEFKSLADFMEYVKVKDDYAEEMMSMAF